MRTGTDAAGIMKKHYDNISKNMGYTVLPAPGSLAFLAHDALSKKDYHKAKDLFELYIHDYPGDSNAYEGLGDYDAAVGDKKNAAFNYKMALSIEDNAYLRKKIDELSLKKK
jgi:tetratricopeptide (TPR) repeat protein